MKNFILGAVSTLLVLLTGACGYLLLGFGEVRGDLPPSRLESAFMTRAVHASVRREAPEVANPFPPTDENLIAGGRTYLNQCAGCHGTPGEPAKYPGALYPDAPHLPTTGTEYTEAQIFWVAKHGVRHSGMFANGLWDSEETLWKAASFIKRIRSLPPGVSSAVLEKKAN